MLFWTSVLFVEEEMTGKTIAESSLSEEQRPEEGSPT